MKKLILLLIIPLITFGQNQDNCITKEIVEENYTYNGCVNYEGTPNGKGKFSQSNGLKYDGMFKDFKFHGYGVLTFPNGNIYKGNFVEGKRQGQGELNYTNGNNYVGFFKNDMYWGQGIQTLYFDEQTQVRDGFFSENTFQYGTETITFNRSGIIDIYEYKDFDIIKDVRKENQVLVSEQIGDFFSNGRLNNGSEINYDGNLQTYIEYKNGKEVSRATNIDNRYNEQDIIGSEDRIEIDLEVEGNTKYMYVNFESEDEPYRFVFDTGAESFVIGYLLFEELKSKGLAFEEMGIKTTTRGVSGIPFESKVIKINTISIGSFTVKNIYASVPLIETANAVKVAVAGVESFREGKPVTINWD